MFKKALVILLLFIGIRAYGSDNFLNSIVLDNNNGNNSIIFRSDYITKMKREVESQDKVVITLKGVKQSRDINTLYKNSSAIDGLVIQNDGGDLKIYIEAPNVSKASIIFETPDSAPITVADNKVEGLLIWSVISVLLLLFIMRSARKMSFEPQPKDVNEIIKDREKELYRNFQREVATLPSINYKLKSYRKHVLKGETIRSYENRLSKI